jgi:phage terminase large subunit-like protein
LGRSVDVRDYVAIAEKYAKDVIEEKIPACQWVRKACQRQIEDRKRSKFKEYPWRFDESKAVHFCKFAELLPHVKGRWATENITLEPWQCFIFTTIFGWVSKGDGYRRFRKALVVVPRKNGKSFVAAIVGLYLLALDKEPGCEVYSAATTRDQAKVVWDVARRMAQKTAWLRDKFGVEPLARSIVVESEGGTFQPLSRDADSLEGLNPHGSVIDELHAHRTREVFDVLDEATGSRQQPLIFIISTEGDNSAGVFAEQVEYAQHILDGRHEDDSYFSVVYSIDPEDDWTTREAWAKANPNLGVSVLEKDLEIRCRQAEKNAASQSSFMTKRLNVRVGAANSYFNMLAWRTICKDGSLRIEDFYNAECFVGLDLASRNDVAAKIILVNKGDRPSIFGKYYLPEDCIDRGRDNYDIYRGWADSGLLTLTPGNSIDFEFIERDIVDHDYKNFDLVEVAVDGYQARYLTTRLEKEGIKCLEIPQGYAHMSEPMKDLGARIMSGAIRHDGNPILDWMIGNTMAKTDARENVMPTKSRPENKNDGAIGTIMALGRLMFAEENSMSYTGLRSVG